MGTEASGKEKSYIRLRAKDHQQGSEMEFRIKESVAEQAAEEKAAIRIQLIVKGQQGMEVLFKIGKATPLSELKDVYCSRFGLTAAQVSFWVDGVRDGPDDTAEKLGLEDEDRIAAAIQRARGPWGRMK